MRQRRFSEPATSSRSTMKAEDYVSHVFEDDLKPPHVYTFEPEVTPMPAEFNRENFTGRTDASL